MHKLAPIVFCLFFYGAIFGQSEIYELRVYELEFFKPANVLYDYFEKALIPALNRQGIKNIGAFEELGEALPKKVYLLVNYPDMQAHQKVGDALLQDKQFMIDAEPYLKAPPEKIAFNRYETSLIRSTKGFPELVKPDDDSELFELRIYDSYNEDALRRKVKMFNDAEFGIFKEAGLPTVFFGSNFSGSQMPCLTYLLAFKDMQAHDQAWSRFGSNPEWKRISGLEEYAEAMNNITRIFLKPLGFSQL